MKPLPALSDQLERYLYQLPSLDRTQDFVGERPRCCAVVRASGRDCASAAICLGSGMFGAHCYSHATGTERDQYRAHHEQVSARQARSHEDLRDLQRAVGENIAAQWISGRKQRAQWVAAIVATD